MSYNVFRHRKKGKKKKKKESVIYSHHKLQIWLNKYLGVVTWRELIGGTYLKNYFTSPPTSSSSPHTQHITIPFLSSLFFRHTLTHVSQSLVPQFFGCILSNIHLPFSYLSLHDVQGAFLLTSSNNHASSIQLSSTDTEMVYHPSFT